MRNLFTKSTRKLQNTHPLQAQAHPHDSTSWRMGRGGSAGGPRAVSSPRGLLAGMPWVSCPRIDDLYLKCLRVASLRPSRPLWPSGDWRGADTLRRSRSLALVLFWKAARHSMLEGEKVFSAWGWPQLTLHGFLHSVLVNHEHVLALRQIYTKYNGIKSLHSLYYQIFSATPTALW